MVSLSPDPLLTPLPGTLLRSVGALKVGEYYRTRTLTGHYAEKLLDDYMLAGVPNARGRRDTIICWVSAVLDSSGSERLE